MQAPSREEGFTVRRDFVLHATSLLYAGQIIALDVMSLAAWRFLS